MCGNILCFKKKKVKILLYNIIETFSRFRKAGTNWFLKDKRQTDASARSHQNQMDHHLVKRTFFDRKKGVSEKCTCWQRNSWKFPSHRLSREPQLEMILKGKKKIKMGNRHSK